MRYFSIFAFLTVTCAGSALAQDCNNGSLTGAYAYATNGTATVNGTTITNSEVGRLVFDGKGGFTGVAVATTNGKTEVGTATGTYAIGSDCTMTGKAGTGADAIDFDAVVVNSGSDFLFVLREPSVTRAGGGTKIEAQGACTLGTVTGSYGYQGDGAITTNNVVSSGAEIGIMNFDGAGAFNGVYSFSRAGTVERRTTTGTYTMLPECIGVAGYAIGSDAYVMTFVLNQNGNGFVYSEAGPGVVLTGAGNRTSPK